MKITDGTHSPADFPPSNSSNSQPSSERKLRRRRTSKPVTAAVFCRLRRREVSTGRISSALETPRLRWKFDDGRDAADSPAAGRRGYHRRCRGGDTEVLVSARTLAAGFWQLAAEVRAGVGGGISSQCRPFDRLKLEPDVGQLSIMFPSSHSGRDYDVKKKAWLQSPLWAYGPKHNTLYKTSSPFPTFVMEGVTKWDSGYTKSSPKVCRLFSQRKLLENQQNITVPIVSALRAELLQAQSRIQALETKRQSSKKMVEQFLKKLREERDIWMKTEHKKIRGIVDDLKHELYRERRTCQRMENVNSRLLNDLVDAKISAKECMLGYEKERKTRGLLEEVCCELERKIEEDKNEFEELKREFIKIHEEAEEERKMQQMAEVRREERVQMKLVDAKLVLEEKYRQMNNLIADLETFLRSRDVNLDMIEMSETEVIRHTVTSVNIQDIKEFSYRPQNSNDSTIENPQDHEAEKRVTDHLSYSCDGKASEIYTSEVNEFSQNRAQMHSNGFDRGVLKETSVLETVTRSQEQGSSYISDGSNFYLKRINRSRNVARDGTVHKESGGQKYLDSEISKICSVSAVHPMKKPSPILELWRPSPRNTDVEKTILVQVKGMVSVGSASDMRTVSLDGRSVEGGVVCPDISGQWSSSDMKNSHITRGVKGCIEWPRGAHSYGLKAKLLETSFENQNPQVRKCT